MRRRRTTRSPHPTHARPKAADVFVVRRGAQWLVGLFGHPLLVGWRSAEVAKARAREFARTRRVDVWLAKPGASLERLVSYR